MPKKLRVHFKIIELFITTVFALFLFSGCAIKTESIQFDNDKTSINVGERIPLKFSIGPANATKQNVELLSSDDNIAKIEGYDLIALAEGTVTVIALQDNYYYDTYTVVVNPVLPNTIFFSSKEMDLGIGRTHDLEVNTIPENASNKNFSFESSDPSIAQIAGGQLIGLVAGSATITATHESGLTAQFIVNISPVQLDNMLINGESTIQLGGTGVFDVTFNPADVTEKTVTWSSSNKSVLAVSKTGEYVAKKVGTATVTVKHPSGITVTKEIEVTPVYAEEVHLTSDKGGIIYQNESIKLTATILPENTTDKKIVWSSDNPSVATVSNGKVIGIEPGSASIIAKTSNNIVASYRVTIERSTKPMKVTISSYCSDYNHVGNEWGSYYSVNGVAVTSGSTVNITRNKSVSVYTEIAEYDKYTDLGTGSYSMKIIPSYFDDGFWIELEIYVQEGNGRYSGNVAVWTVRYEFS